MKRKDTIIHNEMHPKQVITYRYAYVVGRVTLCRSCEKDWKGAALGPVEHGQGYSYCDNCQLK